MFRRGSSEARRNTDELWRIYGELKRARAARYGTTGTPDDAAALAAIQNVVTAEDSCAMSNLVNLQVTDSRGGHMSYAEALARRSHDSWTPQNIDVSFTSGETWTYRQSPAQQVCRVPVTR